jgi:phospholipase/lecithinase/hemolysin
LRKCRLLKKASMRASPGLFRLCILTAIAATVASSAAKADSITYPFQQFVVFGDSVSDTGNATANNVDSAVPPYYDSGRYTDGSTTVPSTQLQGVWHEQLARQLGIPVAQPEVNGGTNYGYGGAVTGPGATGYLGLQDQVNLFLSKGAPPANALYLFWGGVNDVTLPYITSNAAANQAATNATQNIQQQIGLLAAGGAHDFLWVNLPPILDFPSERNSTLDLNGAAQLFNTQELAAIQQLKSEYAGINITDVDAYALWLRIFADPAQYGISNLTDNAQTQPGIVDPDTYAYWLSDHPTTQLHKAVADLANLDLQNTYAADVAPGVVPEPGTEALLVLSALLFGVVRLRKRTRP